MRSLFLLFFPWLLPAGTTYSWHSNYNEKSALVNRFDAPAGFKRSETKPGTFAHWLRHLPLHDKGHSVHLYNGKLKPNQDVHAAVVDIDAGKSDLQQCADAVMRLRGEYLYAAGRYGDIHFNFTSGDPASFRKWSQGYRPSIRGNKVSWNKVAAKDSSHRSFRQFMDIVFTYAGTLSLSKEMKKVPLSELDIGDVFIIGGSPGHAVMVVDLAKNPATGEKLFLLVQSYMPAQEIHVLKNYNDKSRSPWYSASLSGDLETPEWTFTKDQLRRF